MGKKLVLLLLGVLLIGSIGGALWFVGQREQEIEIPRESFIPNNSAVVLNIQAHVSLSPELQIIFKQDIAAHQSTWLYRIVDSLRRRSFVTADSRVLALRVEGRKTIRSLYILNRDASFARGDVFHFLQSAFGGNGIKEKAFDKYHIYHLPQKGQDLYFSVVGGRVLLSDSELYVEDALKQIDRENQPDNRETPRYKNMMRYLSASAGINVFLNTSCFTDLFPLYVRRDILSEQSNLCQWFKWGALDVDLKADGVSVNGFLQYAGMKRSFMRLLQGQQAGEARLEKVLPAGLQAAGVLRLSEVKTYGTELEKYRLDAGLLESFRKRKQEYLHWFGKEHEKRWQALLQGEFAKGIYAYQPASRTCDGLLIVSLKSGSLAESLLREMLEYYSQQVNIHISSLERIYRLDKSKQLNYYKWPAPDFAFVMWGDWLDKVPAHYALVQDNYLVLASSEAAIQRFAKDYVRKNTLCDMDWYKKMKQKLPSKYNWQYFSNFPQLHAFYQDQAVGEGARYLLQRRESLSAFSAFGLQWSNEEHLLYQSLFLSTEPEVRQQARVLWQTKLDAPVAMKPVLVKNHNTGEREILVQDANNTVYLINDIGRVLWKLPVQGKINSEVYQVDYYKNGKLQYLFSTSTHLYLIDRNGHYLPRYPLLFPSACPMGIALFDYEQDRNYRIFVPGEDQKIYLYQLDGSLVKGWTTPHCDNPIHSKVHHFRVAGKDYIVCVDRYRVYLFDRKGNLRVNLATLFDLLPGTLLYSFREQGQEKFAFVNASGEVIKIDFAGNVQRVQGERPTDGYKFNVADLNVDGADELLFVRENALSVYDGNGKRLHYQKWEGAALSYPYVYRFSAKDVRVGLWDQRQNRLLLTNLKTASGGFPLEGSSPFSIAFFSEGSAGFYLFAANLEGCLMKYQL